MSAALQAIGLSKQYGDLSALDPLDLTIGDAELVMLVGHNGSGKTTLLRMASGLMEPTDGEVLVAGNPAGSLPARATLSFIPDNPVLFDDLTLLEHLHFVARLHGVDGDEADERARGLLDFLNLSARADGLPSTFVRGLRQKTSIALGVIRPFSVLLVDEPFVGLDQGGKTAMLELLSGAVDQGATVVVATHSLEFAELHPRCVALRDGALVHDGPASVSEVEQLVT